MPVVISVHTVEEVPDKALKFRYTLPPAATYTRLLSWGSMAHADGRLASAAPAWIHVTAEPVGGPDHVRELLARQVCSPVLWERSVRHALEAGVDGFLEAGPGTVLAGLMRKIEPQAGVRPAATPQDLEGQG